jgi:signal transduction histidine kinase
MTREPVRAEPVPFDAERTLLMFLLVIRAVVVVVALIALVSGWDRYRSHGLVAGAFLVAAGGSAWVAAESLRRGAFVSGWRAVVDVGVGLAALVGCGLAMSPALRLTSLNWSNVFAITAVGPGAAVAHRRLAAGAISVVLLAGTTLVLASPHAQQLDLLSTAAYYAGLFLAARYIAGRVRGWARERDVLESERNAAERALAVEQERNRQHRLLHDTALQMLEAIGSGATVDEATRARCLRDAAHLRAALRGQPVDGSGDILGALAELTEEFAERGLRIELTTLDLDAEPSSEAVAALAWATREALTNVRRHAGVDRAVVSVGDADDGIEVVVRDHGRGFEPDTQMGFGLSNSIDRRLRDVGGKVEVWSMPGRGTRVRMWAS